VPEGGEDPFLSPDLERLRGNVLALLSGHRSRSPQVLRKYVFFVTPLPARLVFGPWPNDDTLKNKLDTTLVVFRPESYGIDDVIMFVMLKRAEGFEASSEETP